MRILRHFFTKLRIKRKERVFRGRLSYLFFNNHKSSLVIVFSGFPAGRKPLYNYVETLRGFRGMDKLFLLDVFGYKGGYYLYENGEMLPKELTLQLISEMRKKYGYSHIYTAGSSKGATAALYFGLEIGADAVFYGSGQFHIGEYLFIDKHKPIFYAMMGQAAYRREILLLDGIMPEQISSHLNSSTIVHLHYSTDEPGHLKDIEQLKAALDAADIVYTETIESFTKHSDNGHYFGPFLLRELRKL